MTAGRDTKREHCKATTSCRSFQKHTFECHVKAGGYTYILYMYIFIHTPTTLSSWLRAVFCSLLESIPLLSNDYLKNNLQHFRMAKSPEFICIILPNFILLSLVTSPSLKNLSFHMSHTSQFSPKQCYTAHNLCLFYFSIAVHFCKYYSSLHLFRRHPEQRISFMKYPQCCSNPPCLF